MTLLARRATVATLVALSLVVGWAGAASAQDPRETLVQTAAREWLALADKGDWDAAWNAAGEKLRREQPLSVWRGLLKQYREPFGAVVQRAAISTAFRNDMPDAVSGQFARLQFRTAFSKNSEGHESLTLELEPDGKWRVIGYFIR